jgi:hypothetical protein
MKNVVLILAFVWILGGGFFLPVFVLHEIVDKIW